MKPKLFLLHFAGGNKYSYQFLLPYLNDFNVITLELPGRGRRVKEALIDDFDIAATDLVKQFMDNGPLSNFVIYGHSMGANLALKIAELLSELKQGPRAIVVSGSPGPGIEVKLKRHLLEKNAFKQELKEIGGMPDGFWHDEDIFDFFEPILRADFKLAENVDPLTFKAISCPIYVLMGDREELNKYIDNWQSYTLNKADSRILKGGHFFIYHFPEIIARTIVQGYNQIHHHG